MPVRSFAVSRLAFERTPSTTCSCFALIPVFPFVVINLIPAVIGVPLRTFALATVLGITPSTLIYASIGDALGAVAEGEIALDSSVLTQPRFVLPLVGLAALALLPVLYRWIRGTPTQLPTMRTFALATPARTSVERGLEERNLGVASPLTRVHH